MGHQSTEKNKNNFFCTSDTYVDSFRAINFFKVQKYRRMDKFKKCIKQRCGSISF